MSCRHFIDTEIIEAEGGGKPKEKGGNGEFQV